MAFDRNRSKVLKRNRALRYLRVCGLEEIRPVLKTARFKTRRFIFNQ